MEGYIICVTMLFYVTYFVFYKYNSSSCLILECASLSLIHFSASLYPSCLPLLHFLQDFLVTEFSGNSSSLLRFSSIILIHSYLHLPFPFPPFTLFCQTNSSNSSSVISSSNLIRSLPSFIRLTGGPVSSSFPHLTLCHDK